MEAPRARSAGRPRAAAARGGLRARRGGDGRDRLGDRCRRRAEAPDGVSLREVQRSPRPRANRSDGGGDLAGTITAGSPTASRRIEPLIRLRSPSSSPRVVTTSSARVGCASSRDRTSRRCGRGGTLVSLARPRNLPGHRRVIRPNAYATTPCFTQERDRPDGSVWRRDAGLPSIAETLLRIAAGEIDVVPENRTKLTAARSGFAWSSCRVLEARPNGRRSRISTADREAPPQTARLTVASSRRS